MSEKQVNIKITASTKEFDNAIKKAQKQIEGLAEAIDELGSSKFGDKLEQKFDSLVKAIKKTEDQISDMLDSFDELGKTKLDKVEDGIEDVNKSVEKLNETSEETTESIEGINKVKFNKIGDQFKDIIDSGKDVSEKAQDILDLLDKVDRQDLNGLESEFDQVHSALERISTETRNSTEDLERCFSEVTEEVNDFINKLNDVDYVHFNEFSDVLQEANKRLEELTEQQNKFNNEASELDSSGLDRYADAMKKITSADGTVNIDTKTSNKGGNNLKDALTEGLISGAVESKIMANSLEKVADRLDDVNEKMEHLADIANDDLDKSINELGEEYKEAESALEKLGKEYEEHNKELEKSSAIYNELKNVIDDYEKEERELVDACVEANDAMKKHKAQVEDITKFQEQWNAQSAELRKQIADNAKALDELNKVYDENEAKCSAAEDKCAELNETLAELKKKYEEAAKAALELDKAGDEAGAEKKAEEWAQLGETIEDVKKQLKEAEDAFDAIDNEGYDIWSRIEALEEEKKALQELYDIRKKTVKEMEARDGSSMKDTFAEMKEELKRLEDEADKAKKAFEELGDSAKGDEYVQAQAALWAYGQDIGKTIKNIKQLNDVMNSHKEAMAENNKVGQKYADAFNEQYEAYEKLSKRVKAYLENEENGILLREKVAKSFRDVANSMEAVYKDSSKLNNADLVTKTLAEAAEYVKDLNLVSTENLQADLKRLGEVVEDKVEKIKRFKELNKDFGSDASNQAYGIEKQAQAIRDWANSADFALEASKTLTNAWGDLKAAGEDHLKIRERSKYIEDFGKTLEENVAHIKNYYHELETLDEIYEECTDVQKGILDDYKMWEKNRDALLKYNKEITDYLRALRDTGGEIDAKFLDDLGNFSPQKFIDNFEKMGATSMQLQKHINAVKIELTESIKQYKDNADAARDNAKAIADNAKEVLDSAKAKRDAIQAEVDHAKQIVQTATSMEQVNKATEEYKEGSKKLAEAIKEVEKAQEQYNQATKDADNWEDRRLQTLKEQIQEYNRLAAAMREIGMAANDLGKADIAKFDTSLASLLDRIGTFENDLPNSFAAIKEDIMAVFSDLDSLDLGGVFDGLKDVGAGIFAALPTEVKATAAAIGALTFALKECAQEGVSQFTRGMDTLQGALSGIVGIARDVGQEIFDAFSNITGMDLDFSSMIEIPVEFEAQMTRAGAIVGATGEELEKLEEKARKLGATTVYSATEVAQAMEHMGQAGWDYEAIMAGIEGVLSLATVADMDLAQASEFVTDAINALGMEASDASDMVDMLNTVSVKTSTSVAQMQRAFSNCAPVAGTLGINMKDLSMALGLMANQGVKGAKAGTAMKNLMANLSAPTEKQLSYIKKFNLEGAQQAIVNGNLLDGIKQMKQALAGLTPQQQNAVITTIAGKEALSGISALLNSTTEDITELESAMDNCSGSANEMAKNFEKTLKGAMNNLAGAIEEALIQVKDKVEGGVASVINELTTLVNILTGIEQSSSGLTGIAGVFEHLEEATQRWGEAIENGLTKAIGAIDDFLNSASFDNLLQAGTNIINGIAEGIKNAADNGTLGSAISTAIGKLATWFADNLETVIEVGKEIIAAISKGISENSDEIGRAIRAVMEMQTEIDKAVAKEKWKLIGQNLISFICEGIVSKVSVFVSAFTGFFEGCIGDIANAFNDLVLNKLSPMLLDPIAIMGEVIGNFLKEVLLSALERAFDIDLSYFKDFNIFNPSSWFGDKDKKKNTSNKKSNSSNKGKKDTGSGWDGFKKELESWGKAISDWGTDVSGKIEEAWINITSKFSSGEKDTNKSISDSWASVKKELDNWGQGISDWGTDIGNWFSESWDKICDSFSTGGKDTSKSASDSWASVKETLSNWGQGIDEWGANAGTSISNAWNSAVTSFSEWKTGIAEWGTETGEELSKVGNNIKTFFTETLPSYLDPEKLGSALGTLTGTIAKGVADGWTALDEWGNELYIKGSEAAIKYSDGIRDFIINLPTNITTWLTNASEAFIQWSYDLYNKGKEATSNFILGVGEGFVNLCTSISNWLTETSEAFIQWSVDLYTKGKEATANFILGVGEGFVQLCTNISNWLTQASESIIQWSVDLYTKGKEAATKFVLGVGEGFNKLFTDIANWLSKATQAVSKWGKELYTKGKEAINNLIKGFVEGLKQLPSKITSGLSSGKKAVTTWGNDVKKSASSAGKNIVNGIFSGMNGFKSAITSWCSRFKSSFVSSFKKAFGIHSPSTVMRDEVGVNLALGIEEGLNSGAGNIAQTAGNILSSVKGSIGNIWNNLFGNSDNSELLNLSPEGIKAATVSLSALSLALTDAKENISTIGMAFNSLCLSLTNVSEITNAIRAAFMSIANIITNQVTNARNALTSQFLSMAAVARTQMVNISNIVRNQAVAWANIISNQAKNARDNLTRQFMSMAAVVRTQMSKCLSSVKSVMSQISSATNKSMSMNVNVNRTMSASYAMPSANALYAANNASTFSLGGNTGALAYSASSAMSSGSNASNGGNSRGMSDGQIIHTHVYLEGKEIAKASAKYMEGELKTITNRENRKRGAK